MTTRRLERSWNGRKSQEASSIVVNAFKQKQLFETKQGIAWKGGVLGVCVRERGNSIVSIGRDMNTYPARCDVEPKQQGGQLDL